MIALSGALVTNNRVIDGFQIFYYHFGIFVERSIYFITNSVTPLFGEFAAVSQRGLS